MMLRPAMFASLLAVLLAGLPLGAQDRLPQRLPPVPVERTAPAQDVPDVVLFAAAAARLRPPVGWWVQEVPIGREVRLVISPHELRRTDPMPVDGLWLTYHPRAPAAESAQNELLELVESRLRKAIGQAAVLKPPRLHQLAGWPAVEQEFERTVGPTPVRGSHILARTDWGVFELHASSPADRYEARSAQFHQLLSQLVLAAPREEFGPVESESQAAAEILGAWKAYRSRLRLYGSGRIEIELDRPQVIPPQRSSQPYEDARTTLRGRFQADQDLLRVVWDDGTRLNFRWALSGDHLLLTDHEGQISQLRRLYE